MNPSDPLAGTIVACRTINLSGAVERYRRRKPLASAAKLTDRVLEARSAVGPQDRIELVTPYRLALVCFMLAADGILETVTFKPEAQRLLDSACPRKTTPAALTIDVP